LLFATLGLAFVATPAVAQPHACANASLTANSLKAVLQHTSLPSSHDAGAPPDALTQGTGGIDADGALRQAPPVGAYEAPIATCAKKANR
jgi:hypothetical protein